MSLRAKKSFVWLWVAALVTATVGVSVQQIYCYCLGETTFSLFAAEDACTLVEASAKPDCCAQSIALPSCCEKDDSFSEKKHGCTHKSTKIFQLKTEFVVDKPFEKTFDCPLWMEQMPVFKRLFRPAVCETVFSNKAPPPPLSGRDICLRHQIFRC